MFLASRKWFLRNLGDREGVIEKISVQIEFFRFSFSINSTFHQKNVRAIFSLP